MMKFLAVCVLVIISFATLGTAMPHHKTAKMSKIHQDFEEVSKIMKKANALKAKAHNSAPQLEEDSDEDDEAHFAPSVPSKAHAKVIKGKSLSKAAVKKAKSVKLEEDMPASKSTHSTAAKHIAKHASVKPLENSESSETDSTSDHREARTTSSKKPTMARSAAKHIAKHSAVDKTVPKAEENSADNDETDLEEAHSKKSTMSRLPSEFDDEDEDRDGESASTTKKANVSKKAALKPIQAEEEGDEFDSDVENAFGEDTLPATTSTITKVSSKKTAKVVSKPVIAKKKSAKVVSADADSEGDVAEAPLDQDEGIFNTAYNYVFGDQNTAVDAEENADAEAESAVDVDENNADVDAEANVNSDEAEEIDPETPETPSSDEDKGMFSRLKDTVKGVLNLEEESEAGAPLSAEDSE